MKRQIFRQVALERLSSPEQLDQMMQVTTPRGWLALLALLGLIVTVVAWSFNDTIPTEAIGRGMLLRGGRVLRVVASTAGQVETIGVRSGDIVQPGQVIGAIKPGLGPDRTAPGEQPVAVVSPYAGRVVEVASAPGGVIAQGDTLVSLEDASKPLEAVIYMPPEQGQNVQPGMQVQISPTNIRREEYGFIRARVREVATFPSTFQGKSTLFRMLLGFEMPQTGSVYYDKPHIPKVIPGRTRPKDRHPDALSWGHSRPPMKGDQDDWAHDTPSGIDQHSGQLAVSDLASGYVQTDGTVLRHLAAGCDQCRAPA